MSLKKRLVYLYVTIILALGILVGGMLLSETLSGLPFIAIQIISWGLFWLLLVVAIRLELGGGPYRCKHCGHEFEIDFWTFVRSIHMNTTRLLKCPECGKRTWCKKVWK